MMGSRTPTSRPFLATVKRSGCFRQATFPRSGWFVWETCFFRAQCQPEMKSSADYPIAFVVKSTPAVIDDKACVEKFLQSSCTCPAGRGPLATCKHIAAVLNALEHFCRLGFTKEPVTCTERLQQWNKPQSKKVAVLTVQEMDFRKNSLGKQVKGNDKRCSQPKHADSLIHDQAANTARLWNGSKNCFKESCPLIRTK